MPLVKYNKNKKKPLVNIIIPSYNQEKYIQNAIESAISQDFDGDFCVTVIDDCSTDGSMSIIKSFESDIVIVKNDENIGVTKSRDRIIREYNTNFYVPLDADDAISRDFLSKTMDLMMVHDNKYAFVYTDAVYFNNDNKGQLVKSPDYNFFSLVQANYINYCSLISRTEYIHCGGYDLNNRGYFEDWQLSIRLGKYGLYGIHLAEPLFFHRLHDESAMHGSFIQLNDGAIRAYIVTTMPEVFPREWYGTSLDILKNYPENFMSLKQ